MSNLLEIVALAAAVAYVVISQVRGQSLQAKRLVMVPAVLIVIGTMGLAGMPGFRAADMACITASALVAVATGVGQGAMTRIEARAGAAWGKLPPRGLWLWAALILSRVAVMVVAHNIGAEAAASLDSVVVVLGVNRLAQAAAIVARAGRAGLQLAL